MTLRRWVRAAVPLLPAILAFMIAASTVFPLDWLGLVVNVRTESERLIYMLGALLAVSGASYLHLYWESERDKKSAEALESRLDEFRGHLAALRENKALIAQIEGQLDLLPEKARVLSRYAGRYMLARLDGILNRETFEIQGGFFFQDFYREVFKEFAAPCDLIATADATRSYFWRGRDLNEMFRDFIGKGGSLTRIFFLESLDQLQDNATLDIMRGQHRAGVRVHYIVRSELREARYMLADRQRTFGWILHTVESGEIDRVQVSWNAQTADECCKYLISVLEHEATTRFSG